jgi:hypothetical protein
VQKSLQTSHETTHETSGGPAARCEATARFPAPGLADRSAASYSMTASEVPVAPAAELTLVRADYPPDEELAARTLVTRARRC